MKIEEILELLDNGSIDIKEANKLIDNVIKLHEAEANSQGFKEAIDIIEKHIQFDKD